MPVPRPLLVALRWLLQFPLSIAHWAVLLAVLLGLAALQLHLGQRIIEQTNFKPESRDQSAYMRLAEKSRGDWWPTKTDGIRNPLFVWLARGLVQPDDDAFLFAGKQFNLRLATAAALVLGVFFGCFLPLLPTLTLSILAGFAVLLPIGTFFGAEPLFYTLFFGYWICVLASLRRNPLWLYALAGALAATAYLAKLGVTLLTGMFILASAWRWWQSRHAGANGAAGAWSSRRLLIGAALFAVIYGAIVAPRAIYSQREFGAPFYTLTSQRFWAKNLNEISPIVHLLNPKRIHEVPPEQRPGMRNYFRTHTVGEFVERLTTGARNQLALFWGGSHEWASNRESWENGQPRHGISRLILLRGAYVAALALVTITLAACAGGWRALDDAARTTTLTVVAIFVVHLLAFGWYTHYTTLSRFMLSLYIPLAFSLAWAAEALRRHSRQPWVPALYAAVHLAMLATLIPRLITLARFPVFSGLRGAF